MADTNDDTDETLLKWIKQCISRSLAKSADWRKAARKDYDFYAGCQWDEDDISEMKDQRRVPIVFNRIARAINAVSGMQRQNRQASSFSPRETNDSEISEYVADVVSWVRELTEGEDEESEAFEDAVICGMGWVETSMNYEEEPSGMIKMDRIDPIEMGWDTNAKKRNLKDTQYRYRVKKNVSMKDFRDTWPGKEPQEWKINIDLESDDPHDAHEALYYKNKQTADDASADKEVTVVQFQWWERKRTYFIEMGDQLAELDSAQYKHAKADLDAIGVEPEVRFRRHYRQAFVNGNQILEVVDAPCQYGFSFQPVTGFRKRKDNTWFGLVSLMRDPQMYANKWLSQIVYILSTNSKGGLFAERDAFENPQKAEDDYASPDRIIWLQSGALNSNKIQEKTMANFPSGLDKLLGYAMEAISDVPGVNQELMGVANREQAGYLEDQRKQAGLTILATFFDSFRRYTKSQGRLTLEFVREYVPEGTLMRIGDPQQRQYAPLLKDRLTYTFDISVDDAPTSPNMKERVFGAVSYLLQTLVPAGVPVPAEIFDYSPLPSKLVTAWKQAMVPPPPDPQQVAVHQAMQQLEVEGKAAENEKTKVESKEIETKATLNEAKTYETMIEAGKDPKTKAVK